MIFINPNLSVTDGMLFKHYLTLGEMFSQTWSIHNETGRTTAEPILYYFPDMLTNASSVVYGINRTV